MVVRGEGGKEQTLREGDEAYTTTEENRKIEIENNGDGVREVLLFDFAKHLGLYSSHGLS